MKKVDHLGWVDGIVFNPQGTRIGVRTNDPSCLEELESIVKDHGWQLCQDAEADILFSLRVGPPAERGRKNFHLLYLGASRVVRSLELSDALEYLELRLPEIVRYTARDSVFIPGSVLLLEDRPLILPGEAGTGRKTLTDELVRLGAHIVTDSYFAVGPDGNLQMTDVADANPVICFTEYSRRNKTLRARTLSPGETSLHLFASGLSSRSQPAMVMSAISQLAVKSRSLRGKRGEAGQAARYLQRKLRELPLTAG